MPPWLMPTSILLLVVLLIFAFVFRRRGGGARREAVHGDADVDKALEDCDIGDRLRIESSLLPASPLLMTVDRLDGYDEDGDRWCEYSGMVDGRRYFVELGDGCNPLLTIATDLPLAATGLRREELEEADEDDGLSCRFQDRTYHLQDCGEAGYDEGCTGELEGFRYWDFRSEDGAHSLCIEDWGDEAPVCSHAVRVDRLAYAAT